MNTHLSIYRLTSILLCLAMALVSACSGSGDNTAPVSQEPLASSQAVTDPIVADPIVADPVVADPVVADPVVADPVVADPVVADPVVADSAIADPLIQNTVRVDFEIEVPSYQSNALQVWLVWGEQALTAAWIGDEYWSVSGEFPSNTQHRLIATFYDGNGDVTLGSFETVYKTGTNTVESYRINADQFNTDRWDSDGDGTSNLDELTAASAQAEPTRVLLFSETRGYRHDAIANALTALEQLALSAGIHTDLAVDSTGFFTSDTLVDYDAVVWVLTSGDVLDSDEQAAFEQFIRAGGGYAGIHAASDTEYEWPWYGALVGAYFERHPAVQSASQLVEDASHPSTAHLETLWTRTDEWYDYRSNPRARVNVLLSLDESSYQGGGMGRDHPSAWYHAYDGGRSWYTGGGHTAASYSEPAFRAHLLGGLRYAAGTGVIANPSRGS